MLSLKLVEIYIRFVLCGGRHTHVCSTGSGRIIPPYQQSRKLSRVPYSLYERGVEVLCSACMRQEAGSITCIKREAHRYNCESNVSVGSGHRECPSSTRIQGAQEMTNVIDLHFLKHDYGCGAFRKGTYVAFSREETSCVRHPVYN